MLTIACKKENLGLIRTLCEMKKCSDPALNEYYDGTFSYDWCGEDYSEVSKMHNDIIVASKEVDYNEMY